MLLLQRFRSILVLDQRFKLPSCNFCFASQKQNVDGAKERSRPQNIKTVIHSAVANDEIRTRGWVKAFRKLKEQLFLDINDGSTYQRLQIVMPASERPKELTMHSSVDVTGVLVQSPKNASTLELHPTKPIEVLGSCDQKLYPFGGKTPYTPDYIRQYIHLRPKTKKFSSLLRIRSALSRAVNDFFTQNNFIQIHTPILTSNDCEGAGEVFTVMPDNKAMLLEMSKQNSAESKTTNLEEAFFDEKVFLTVSSQLHLEATASALEKVWTFSPVFRAENHISTRHLSEFYMIEAEIAFANEIEQILDIMENLVKFCVQTLLVDNIDEWQFHMRHELNIRKLLENIVKNPFTVMDFNEARQLLAKIDSPVPDGKGLSREQELLLVERINNDNPVFVINWPAKIKPFYMRKCSEDGTNVSAVDLLMPRIGELCGGSLREHNLLELENRIKGAYPPEALNSLQWYLDLRRYGGVPTGGFGMGFDRLLQLITGCGNIKDVSPFPRWAHDCPM